MDIKQILKTNQKYFEDFITRSTYHSNAIEGNTLTYAETYALLFNDNTLTIDNKKPREIYEAINHKNALSYILSKLDEEYTELTLGFIQEIGKIINKNILDIEGFRKVQVIITGAENIPPSPEKVINLMNYYISNYNNDISDIFEKVAKYHIEFETIHPFEDGNGRTGRLLINYELLKNNYYPVIIDQNNRTKYYELIRKNDYKAMAEWFRELSKTEEERVRNFVWFFTNSLNVIDDKLQELFIK